MSSSWPVAIFSSALLGRSGLRPRDTRSAFMRQMTAVWPALWELPTIGRSAAHALGLSFFAFPGLPGLPAETTLAVALRGAPGATSTCSSVVVERGSRPQAPAWMVSVTVCGPGVVKVCGMRNVTVPPGRKTASRAGSWQALRPSRPSRPAKTAWKPLTPASRSRAVTVMVVGSPTTGAGPLICGGSTAGPEPASTSLPVVGSSTGAAGASGSGGAGSDACAAGSGALGAGGAGFGGAGGATGGAGGVHALVWGSGAWTTKSAALSPVSCAPPMRAID